MKGKSRSQNAKINILVGYVTQIGICLLSFIGRRVFLQFLSADYLGINGLYSNIITVLSLAELGLDTAVLYSLYKPVAEHDTKLIKSLLFFFKRLYFVLAILIFIIGAALIPLLKIIIKTDIDETSLIIYYLLFLVNTVSSYFVAHKVALLSAFQEQRIYKMVTLGTNFLLQILYIIVLIIFKNYYAYVSATVCTTIITNIILGIITERLHPEVFNEKELVPIDKKPIVERMKATFLYKIGVVLINSTDNILISMLVGTTAVGFYSNYYTVVYAVSGFLTIITTSVISGIGNFAAQESKRQQKELFEMLLLFYHFVAAVGFIGFDLLLNNFITIWIGEKYLLNGKIVFVIALNFYLANAISPVWMLREANGLFGEVRFLILIRAVLNIVFSIILGLRTGVEGILIATAISLLMTNFWFEPRLLSRKLFDCSSWGYWAKQMKYALITAICFLISSYTIRLVGDDLVGMVVKAILIVGITSLLFLIMNIKSNEFKKIKTYF